MQEPRRIALTLGVQGGASPSALPDLGRYAEKHGFVQAWSEEANATDAVSVLAAATRTTESMQLGTGIIPVFGRAPAVIALEAATMQNLSGGRFVLGLGASSEPIATRWRGEPYSKPVTRLREYVQVLRRLLAGERVAYNGETIQIGGFRIDLDIPSPPPIYIAALGHRTLGLAGELCDGAILAFMTEEAVARAAARVAEAARDAARDPDDVDVAGRLMVIVDEPEDEVRRYVQRLLAFYLSADVYQRSFTRQGFGREVEAFRDRWNAGQRAEAAAGIPQTLIDVAVIAGSTKEVRDRIDRYRAKGLRTPIIYPLTTETHPDARIKRMRAAISALAPRSQ